MAKRVAEALVIAGFASVLLYVAAGTVYWWFPPLMFGIGMLPQYEGD